MQNTDQEIPSPLVSVIVVSYNTRDMTLDCLRSVRSETTVPYELVVLDNASSDGSAKAISDAFPDVSVLCEHHNHGFAKANNIVAAQVRGKYLLLLNPDTIVLNGAIDKLVEFAQARPDAKIWGGRTYYGDRTLNPTSCWRRMTLWGVTSQVLGLSSLFRNNGFLNPEGYGGWARDSEREVDIVTGCFFLIERAFWQDLGGFDLTFVMYGEEVDMCLRARQKGARPRMTPTAEIIHYAGASETVRADKMMRLLRAKVSLIKRHFPTWQRPLGLAMFRYWPLSRMWGKRILRRTEGIEAWDEIWRRRSEWWNGWPDLGP